MGESSRPELLQALLGVRDVFVKAQELFVNPGAADLARCEIGLGRAASQLQVLKRVLEGRSVEDPELSELAGQILEELAHLNRLFQEAGYLYLGWLEIFKTRLVGYTASGEPGPLNCEQQILLRG